jgi:hypothetical protein
VPVRRWARLKVLCSWAYNKALTSGPGLTLSFLLILNCTHLVTG